MPVMMIPEEEHLKAEIRNLKNALAEANKKIHSLTFERDAADARAEEYFNRSTLYTKKIDEQHAKMTQMNDALDQANRTLEEAKKFIDNLPSDITLVVAENEELHRRLTAQDTLNKLLQGKLRVVQHQLSEVKKTQQQNLVTYNKRAYEEKQHFDDYVVKITAQLKETEDALVQACFRRDTVLAENHGLKKRVAELEKQIKSREDSVHNVQVIDTPVGNVAVSKDGVLRLAEQMEREREEMESLRRALKEAHDAPPKRVSTQLGIYAVDEVTVQAMAHHIIECERLVGNLRTENEALRTINERTETHLRSCEKQLYKEQHPDQISALLKAVDDLVRSLPHD